MLKFMAQIDITHVPYRGTGPATTDLIAGSDVARNQVLYTIARVGEFFSSTYFKVVVMLTMIVVAVYAFLFVLAALGVLKPIEKSSKKRTNK